MVITIPRFEKKIKEVPYKISIENKRTVLIKDHKTDKFVIVVNFDETQETNSELADKIIETIEEYLDGNDEH